MMRHQEHYLEGRRIYRFVRVERIAHWVNVVCFFALVATGVVLFLRTWLALTPAVIARLHWAHVVIGFIYFFAPALILTMGGWRIACQWFREAIHWTMSDLIWLLGPLRRILPRRFRNPDVGRFNAGQRINMLGQIVGKWALFISGLYMHLRTGQLFMYSVHLLFFIVLVFLTIGHIYMGLINPSTKPALPAILSGYVDADWVEHHHPRWVRYLKRRETKPQPPPADEPPRQPGQEPPPSDPEARA